MAVAKKVGGKAGVPSTLTKKGTTSSGYTKPSSVYSRPAGGFSQPQVPVGAWNAATTTNPPKVTPPPPAPPKAVTGAPSDVATSYLNPRAGALKGFNNSARDNIYADIAKNAGNAMVDYGYTGRDSNGDGIPDTGFTVDPSNPFSKAQLLMRQYSQAKSGTKTSMAAQGQLYSGALQTALDELGFQEQGAMDSNLKGFNRYLDSLVQGRRDAGLQAERANADVDWDALVAAINAGRG